MSQPYPPYGGYPAGGPGFVGQPAPAGPPPDNYMVWAVLSTIFCFMPLGIVAIIKATEVNSKWAIGDVAGAHQASQEAKKWATWAAYAYVGTIVAVVAIYVIFFVMMFAATSTY